MRFVMWPKTPRLLESRWPPSSRPRYSALKAISLRISSKIPRSFCKCYLLPRAVDVVREARLADKDPDLDQAARAPLAAEFPARPGACGTPLPWRVAEPEVGT